MQAGSHIMRINFSPSPELFPFESRWFDSEVGPVHYVDEGEGRPILFLHGNPTWSFLYRDIIRRLRGEFRCLALDYPGFGLSEHPEGYGYTPGEHARVVADFIAAKELEDLVVMGQDWGGPIGLSAACEHAERVSGLVAGNTWYWPTDRFLTKLFSWGMSTPLMEWAILERNIFVERLMPMATASKLPGEVMRHYRAVLPRTDARLGPAEFPHQLTAAREWLGDLARRVESTLTDRPLLLTWGMKDPAFTPGHYLERWQASFPDHETVRVERASHFIQEDAPEAVAEAIRSRFGSDV